jgi:hypothetical protein
MLSRYATHLGYLYDMFRHDMQCFFATKLEQGHPRGAIKIFPSDQWTRFQLQIFHVTNPIEPPDDVRTVAAI